MPPATTGQAAVLASALLELKYGWVRRRFQNALPRIVSKTLTPINPRLGRDEIVVAQQRGRCVRGGALADINRKRGVAKNYSLTARKVLRTRGPARAPESRRAGF